MPGITRDSRVDADHLAAKVNQWTTGVTRIDSRIGLNEILIANSVVAQLQIPPPESTYDPVGNGVVKTKWTADRNDKITDLKIFGLIVTRGNEVTVG